MASDLENIISARIRTSGPITFAEYMELALYEPAYGYYATGGARTGWTGHYVTSPELDPAFGELWARAVEQIWRGSGRPEAFEVVEIGPGEGGFAAGFFAAIEEVDRDLAGALRYTLVERSSAARERQRARLAGFRAVRWVESIEDAPALDPGCVIAHEVLDNLPVRLARTTTDGVVELRVGQTETGFAFVESPPPGPPAGPWSAAGLPPGHVFEVPTGTRDLIASIDAGVRRGVVVVVDYGVEGAERAARPEGTVVCYSAAGVDDLPLDRPGHKDITAHVDWTALRSMLEDRAFVAAGPIDQAVVLKRLGVGEIQARLRASRSDAVARGDGVGAVSALSRGQAVAALTDPGGLGGLGVMVGARAVPLPPFVTGPPGR